ncbi:hypothetical protein [Rhodoferax fermentans]|uniref:Uncharacterized protein n=1 Tax=Rhodoferax fermentans TaxID=28066 RepID=A0A1T1APF0_RHOFE|nr:hypothetical protein [Rhodoferax fermentans]MBK1683439.1 hypothetical protein [Rhodoferax fermentans]OOV05818.1 hypothetical protein RF819_03010 [Rhodoferax fermentans]
MNPIEALRASGLNPIVIDEDTDLDSALGELLGETATPPRPETNEEFIARVMNFGCPTGALIQSFIIEALMQYSQKVSESDAVWDNGLLNSATCKRTAVWLLAEINAKYKG